MKKTLYIILSAAFRLSTAVEVNYKVNNLKQSHRWLGYKFCTIIE